MTRRLRAGTAARFVRAAALVCAGCLWAAAVAAQATVPDGFEDEQVVGGLSEPVGMAFLPDGRLLVIEQRSARVLLVRVGQTVFTVGTVPGVRTNSGERGLLGIAVDPQWPSRPYLYFHYTTTASAHVRLSRFTVTGDLAGTGNGELTLESASRFDLITDAPDVAGNHNGGSVRFGLDGMLLASLGEDADPCAAQDTSLRGVLLRLDVNGLPAGAGTASKSQLVPDDNPFASSTDADERLVWALGLRNPFRIQVDRVTGEVFIGDVGESQFEEVSRAASGGLDYGWPYLEAMATHFNTCPGRVRPMLTSPVFSYDRGQAGGGQAAVIVAGTYRPPSTASEAFPAEYEGDLFASDYYGGMLWRLEGSGDTWTVAAPVPGQPNAGHWARGMGLASDYAVGPDGALWYCKQASSLAYMDNSGSVRRIRFTDAPPDTNPPPPTPPRAVQFAPPYPVPSAGAVNLPLTLTREARIGLIVYDVRGHRVREVLRPTTQPAGPIDLAWDGRDDDGKLAPNGVYFARLDSDGDEIEHRIVLIR